MQNLDLRGLFFKQILKYRQIFNLKILNHLVHFKMYMQGVKLGKEVKFNGFPFISRARFSEIIIGDNCKFNSSKRSIEIGLFKPCNFATIRKGARIQIGKNSGATGSSIIAAKSITIGNNVLIGAYCTIIDNDFHNIDPKKRSSNNVAEKPVVIQDNVFLGFNCHVLKGVTIGENAVIGAGSVVISNIPPNSIAIGNPCKVIIQRKWQ
jgi:acetyltransferase-like isoleucine patch superfamily enzyme